MQPLNTSTKPTSRPSSSLSNVKTTGKRNNAEGKGTEKFEVNAIKKRPSAAALTAKTPSLTNARITATATRSTALLSQYRIPLRQKDRNVAIASSPVATVNATPKPTSTQRAMRYSPPMAAKTTKMPSHSASRQPQLPTLGKPINKAPLTPKIAGASGSARTTNITTATPQQQQQQPHQRPPTVLTTPLPRRTPRPDSSLSNNSFSHHDAPRDAPRDEFASPVSAFFNNHTNITPRSGSRQSRVDSTNTTPNGTPQPEAIDSWHSHSAHGADGDGLRRQVVTFSPSPEVARPGGPVADSKFFYASEAKSTVGSAPTAGPPSRAFPAPKKASTFCFANGSSLPSNPNPSPGPAATTPVLGGPAPLPSLHSSQADALSSKFFYANGAPDALPSSRFTAPPARPPSTISISSKITTGRPSTATATTIASPTSGYFIQRPVSPLKQPAYPPTAQNPSTASLPVSLGRVATPSTAHSSVSSPLLSRQLSNEGYSRPSRGHARAGSLIIAEPLPLARMVSSYPSSEVSSPTAGLSNATVSFASILQAADDFSEEADDEDSSQNGPRSPTKASDAVDELVTNARRERKVQDLQITNASLEAINRTLERQLRKQTAELRRYRRLSRSGRLSLASVNSRAASDITVEGPLLDPRIGLEDLSEEESDAEEDEEDGLEESDLSDSSEYGSGSSSQQFSPNTMAERDARHRKRDEKRLQLDLSKHQQLLVDSQKINQSLKRCLGWTEELIKEGKRALEYQVRVSDVELGGHVLVAPADAEDDDDEAAVVREAEEMHAVVVDFGHDDTVAGFSKEPQDRDSGIDLPGDGG